jgi:hypothetical protein
MVNLSPKLKEVKALKNIFDFYMYHRCSLMDELGLTLGLIIKNEDSIEEILKYDAGFILSDFEFGNGIDYASRSRFVSNFEQFFFTITWEARRYCIYLKKKRSYSPTGEAISSNLIQCQFESD